MINIKKNVIIMQVCLDIRNRLGGKNYAKICEPISTLIYF